MAYIYEIRNVVNDKVYIGSSKDYEKRWLTHTNELSNGTHANKHLQNAWNNYGEENFKFSVLEEVELSEQYIKEQEWINKVEPFNERGYNIRRTTYQGAESPHTILKKCQDCGNEFETYYDNSIRCDECKSEESDRYLKGKCSKDYLKDPYDGKHVVFTSLNTGAMYIFPLKKNGEIDCRSAEEREQDQIREEMISIFGSYEKWLENWMKWE